MAHMKLMVWRRPGSPIDPRYYNPHSKVPEEEVIKAHEELL